MDSQNGLIPGTEKEREGEAAYKAVNIVCLWEVSCNYIVRDMAKK